MVLLHPPSGCSASTAEHSSSCCSAAVSIDSRMSRSVRRRTAPSAVAALGRRAVWAVAVVAAACVVFGGGGSYESPIKCVSAEGLEEGVIDLNMEIHADEKADAKAAAQAEKEKAEKEELAAKEKAEQERLAKEKAEKEAAAKEKAAADKAAHEQAAAEHKAALDAEREREKEHVEREKARHEAGDIKYPLDLKSIYFSHGAPEPAFDPHVYNYVLNLDHPTDQLAITPQIFKDRTEYAGAEANRPRIEISWDNNRDSIVPEVAAVAVRRQIDLPENREPVTVEIRVINPHDSANFETYTIVVNQAEGDLTVLKSLEATDENGGTVLIQPIPSQDVVTYTAYLPPDTRSFSLKAECLGSWMTIDGASGSNGESFTVVRDLNRHIQIVEVACGHGTKYWQDQQSNRYFLKVMSDYPKEAITVPRMVVDNVGQECQLKEGTVFCPNPKDDKGMTRIIGYSNPQIKYTIESPSKDLQIRLLNQTPSIPFRYRHGLTLRAESGRETEEWPIDFNLPASANWLRIVGWLLGVMLTFLCGALAIILGLTSLLGIGLPFGITEVASTLTFLCQYFCFSNGLRGDGMLSDMADSLKWTTLFWPAPWETAGNRVLGDVTDLNNAHGCLYWTEVIFIGSIVCHLAAMGKIMLESGSTFPHRLMLGGLENRVIHWLLFPAITAASMTLAAPDRPPGHASAAGLTIGLAVAWVAASWWLVKAAVDDKTAVWVWNASTREDGVVDDTTGFWCDSVCDQLTSEPANRSILPVFEWKWSSTVADIDPVQISSETFNRSDYCGESIYSSARQSLRRGESAGGQPPMAKHPKNVEVYRTRAPGAICPGQRMMVGLLRTQWLDTIMTYRGLTLFHNQVHKDGDDVLVPLVVKTSQLRGPCSDGRYQFFFDGVRLPFVKIFDSCIRIVIGLLLGVALARTERGVDGGSFGGVALAGAAGLAYFVYTHPHSRNVENWLYMATMGAVTVTALGLMGGSIGKEPSAVADLFQWIAAIICWGVGAYSVVVIVNLFSAIFCAPLEETRLIERLANCAVSIADHSAEWAVEMPGYTKHPIRDLKAQCSYSNSTKGGVHVSLYNSGEEPTYEFSVDDFKQACRSGALRPPVVSLHSSSTSDVLGYAHINVYDKDRTSRVITEFLTGDPTTRDCASEVAKAVSKQLKVRRDKGVLSVRVVPPRFAAGGMSYKGGSYDDRGGTSTYTPSSSGSYYSGSSSYSK